MIQNADLKNEALQIIKRHNSERQTSW